MAKKISKERVQLFLEGKDFYAYEWMGCHSVKDEYRFCVWAPHAKAVWVTGEWNAWDFTKATPMQRMKDTPVFYITISALKNFCAYKYVVQTTENRYIYKADPYAFHAETRPQTASKIYDEKSFLWEDIAWMMERETWNAKQEPMNIYEMHFGSFKRYEDGSCYNYYAMAKPLIAYLKRMHYTHVEFMPLMEYPYDQSWGYQVTGYFAPTSRYGTPQDFMALINALHKENIGVFLDWVPAHFPKDAHGLFQWDGQPCYEYEQPDRAEHPDWGTVIFDYQKGAVRSFLISSAMFWLQQYHVDGLRVDAVASMLYLDYGRSAGSWRPNQRGGRENLEAISFLQTLNRAVKEKNKGICMMAEESTAFAGVTNEKGLNFDFKWNMGWMNDTLYYMQKDPLFRGGIQDAITFSLSYAFSEHFILPLSHDEVVHGKKSLLDKMPGCYEDKFANLRAYMGYMMAHPGKKLTFMGDELALFEEWSEEKPMDFSMLRFEKHQQYFSFMQALNRLYLAWAPFWQQDDRPEGFEWIAGDDVQQNVLAFLRYDQARNAIVVLCHFGGEILENYQIGVPYSGVYRELFSSDAASFGGGGIANKSVHSRKESMHAKPYSIALTLAPFSTVYFYKKAPRAKKINNSNEME